MLGAVLLLVTACGGDGDEDSPAGKAGGDKAASQAAVTIAPKDGAHDVATSGALKVTAQKGKLKSVKVKDAKGNEVDGKIAGRRRRCGSRAAIWAPRRSTRSTP